jgi:hypothetical protein
MAGCGGKAADARKTASVSGQVTIGGKPVEGAEVHFMSENFTGFGLTDAQGRYHLVQGAVPGPNKVFISKIEGKMEGVSLDPEAGMDAEQFRAAAEGVAGSPDAPKPEDIPHESIPEEYSNPEKTKLTYDVPEAGTESADFRL